MIKTFILMLFGSSVGSCHRHDQGILYHFQLRFLFHVIGMTWGLLLRHPIGVLFGHAIGMTLQIHSLFLPHEYHSQAKYYFISTHLSRLCIWCTQYLLVYKRWAFYAGTIWPHPCLYCYRTVFLWLCRFWVDINFV